MSKTVSKFALAAGIVLAMALTFSCSFDGGGGATYWYSRYGMNASSTNYILGLANQHENLSYNDVKYLRSEGERIGTWLDSYGGVSEQEIKNILIERNYSPKEADYVLTDLKKRGNILGFFNSLIPSYYSIMVYVERE